VIQVTLLLLAAISTKSSSSEIAMALIDHLLFILVVLGHLPAMGKLRQRNCQCLRCRQPDRSVWKRPTIRNDTANRAWCERVPKQLCALIKRTEHAVQSEQISRGHMLYFKSLCAGIVASSLGGLLSVLVLAFIVFRRMPPSPSHTYSIDATVFMCTPIYLAIAVSFMLGCIIAYRLLR